jgi:hypothetical protein
VKNELDRNTANTLRGGTSTYAWVVAPNVDQGEYYYCGPASALQAIAGWCGYVEGSDNKEKLKTLATEMGTTKAGTGYISVATVLNQYTLSNYYYGYKGGSNMDVDEFLNICYNSLYNDRAPILHCYTGRLTYYNGHNTGHFITVSGADLPTGNVRLVDPNHDTEYFGVRTISAAEAFSSIDYSDRHLISTGI